MEYLSGSAKTERMLYQHAALTADETVQLEQFTNRLLNQEPVQYVLGETWFCGLKFEVNPQVLIPRPETEELVEWIIASCRFPVTALTLVDIGTGSGCIPVSLKRRIRKADVHACDISAGAIETASANAARLGAPVHFHALNFLQPETWDSLPETDIIVSNPPYIPAAEKQQMEGNVVNYEPHLALFVPDNDPLVFYRAIAGYARKKLKPAGMIFLEIHEDLGNAVNALFEQEGYATTIKKDMQGKDRMIRAAAV